MPAVTLLFKNFFWNSFFPQFCSKSAWTSNASPSHYLCTISTRDGLTQRPGPPHCWALLWSHPVWLSELSSSQRGLVLHQSSVSSYRISGRGGGMSTRRHLLFLISSLSSMLLCVVSGIKTKLSTLNYWSSCKDIIPFQTLLQGILKLDKVTLGDWIQSRVVMTTLQTNAFQKHYSQLSFQGSKLWFQAVVRQA